MSPSCPNDDQPDDEESEDGWRAWFLEAGYHLRFLLGIAAVVVVSTVVGMGLADLVFDRDDPTAESWRTASPQASSSAPTPTPTPTFALSAEEQALRDAALSMPEPERPAGMDEFSPEGAIATAEYFLSLYPYVYATGDLSEWQAMSDSECVFCNNVITNVTELHSAGGWIDPWQQEVRTVSYGVSDDDAQVWALALEATHDLGVKHDGSGGTSTVDAESLTFVLQLHWTGHNWITEQGDVR